MKKLVLFSSVILTFLFCCCSKSHNTEPVTNPPSGPVTDPPPKPFNPAEISIDSLMRNVSELSGETSVNILGSNYTIFSRSRKFEGNNKAAEYLKSRLKSLGLSIIDQKYSATGRNIIAVQQGEDKENYFIICAHYDCYPDSAISPGADDNASGCSVVLEAARLISRLKPKYSVIYALWDEEEAAIGSRYFADSALAAKMKIKCVMNQDMVGYDINNSRMAELNQPPEYGSVQYGDIIRTINTLYGYGINFTPRTFSAPSDDTFFWGDGFTTVAIGEKMRTLEPQDTLSNFNRYYHTSSDKLDKFDKSYFAKMGKLAITSFAKMIGLDLAAPK